MADNLVVSAQFSHDLRSAVVDLNGLNSWRGLFRFAGLGCLTIGLGLFAWQAESIGWFVLLAIATSIFYSFWLICNHDALHRTLTGWPWFDTLMPRLIAWPVLIPAGTYSQLHWLHHRENGIDLNDPERVQWTAAEYQAAPAWQRWYVRHQWMIDIFVLGSFGLIVKIALHGFKRKISSPHLPTQVGIDMIGIVCMQAIIIKLLSVYAVSLWRYFLFLLILERGIGVVMQTRNHLEHFSLWQHHKNYQLTQLYACRNIKTRPWVNWLMGGLPYHAVHHAFPHIPSYQLPIAFERIQAVLAQHHLPPLVFDSGYIASTLKLRKRFALIESLNLPVEKSTKGLVEC